MSVSSIPKTPLWSGGNTSDCWRSLCAVRHAPKSLQVDLSVDEAFFLIIMPRSHYRLILSSRLTSMGPTSVVSAEIDWLSMEPLLWPPIRRRTRLKQWSFKFG